MDERLKIIDDVIDLNKIKINGINKKSSESRAKMDKEDKRKLHELLSINNDLRKIKFRIVQTLVNTNMGRELKILNIEQLCADIECYKNEFPDTYLSLEEIYKRIFKDYEVNDGATGIFGMSVSPEWEDKCYGFEFVGDCYGGYIIYKYVGIYKC